MTKLNVKVFADGADIEEMKSAYKNQLVDGFTTIKKIKSNAIRKLRRYLNSSTKD